MSKPMPLHDLRFPMGRAVALLAFAFLACATSPERATEASGAAGRGAASAARYAPKREIVEDFAALVPTTTPRDGPRARLLERVTTAVPWPRGLAWADDKLIVLARGRHRRAGGVDASVPDQAGSLFAVDPGICEDVVFGEFASKSVRENATRIASPTAPPFFLHDARLSPGENRLMDRPYCTLIWDETSRNLFICGFSGVDLPGAKFRKNATDSIHRYDFRDGGWHPVEMHDAAAVPDGGLGYVVSNAHYPHHEPSSSDAPHGWLNGPDGGTVAGDWLYCVGKDNHCVAAYDLRDIRQDPRAGWPASKRVLGSRVRVRSPRGEREMELLGPSAARANGGYLYVGYRTSSVVLRFAIHEDGSFVEPVVGELVAVFEPWNLATKRSANLIDLAFDSRGALYVSCAKQGRIWRVGVPDPTSPFYGDDQSERATSAAPFVDLLQLTGKKTNCGNILFDPQDRLYLCAGNYDSGTQLAGVVYRVDTR